MLRQQAVALLTAATVTGCASGSGDPASPPVRPLSPVPRSSPAAASEAPWPGFARDAAHSGSSPALGPQRLRIRWRRHLEGPIAPGPAVGAGGRVYAASNGGVLHAIDLRTGRDLWRFDGHGSYGNDLSTVPAVLADDTVIWPGPRDTVWALDRSGKPKWHVTLDGQGLSPLVGPSTETAYLMDMAGTLRAVDARSGRERWNLSLGSSSYGSPALGTDGTVYVTVDSSLVAVRRGRVAWRVRTGDQVEVSPAVAPDGTVVFASNDHHAYGVSRSGRIRWRFDLRQLSYSSPAATRSGLVVLGDHHGWVRALDSRTGRLRALFAVRDRRAGRASPQVWTAPVLDRRHDVFFGTLDGRVFGYAPNGRKLWELDAGETVDSYPALAADGTLLVGADSGELYAIGP